MLQCGCNSKFCKHRPFVHLHLHTDFSRLDGAGTSVSYIKKAKEYNHPAITILDHGNTSGTPRQDARSVRGRRTHRGTPRGGPIGRGP